MVSTANAVKYLGADPVFADIEPDTWNINPDSVAEKITPRTKAIIPVHIYGHPCEITEVMKLAWENDLYVIEDCAEAHGAEYKGKHTGTFGDMNCYSFYANKIITTGEGGMITTDSESLYERAKWLGAHAFGKKGHHYWHTDIGYGYRMTGMQAALGLSQLSRIDYYIQKRQMNAWYYMHLLSDLRDEGWFTFPVQRKHCTNVYWMFSVLLTDKALAKMSNEKLVTRLGEQGIEARTFFYPLHIQPVYKTDDELPVTMDIYKRGVNLPSGNNLTKEQVQIVCKKLREIILA
jgi:perosamine synthetase